MIYRNLNPEKALIWRIVHLNNLPWILDNGLHCANSKVKFDSYITIGNADLIDRRKSREVPIDPGGTLADYIPFYFTPFSPMLYNIHTGRGEMPKRENEEICLLVTSLYQINEKLKFVFTDRHAYLSTAKYFSRLDQLNEIDWLPLQERNFKRNPDNPEQFERYQAEALIFKHMPVIALKGVICYANEVKLDLEKQVKDRGLNLRIEVIPGWYFS